MGKKRKKFTEEYINASLLSHSPISNFYILGNAMILYYAKHGQVMILTIEDDDFEYACIHYLKKQGVPNFDDHGEEEDKYIENLKPKVKP